MIGKADLEQLARVLGSSATVEEATAKVADLASEGNPRFDYDRFYAAVVTARQNTMRAEQAIRYEGRHSSEGRA